MFPPIRMANLFPVKPRNEGDTVESLYNRFNSLIPHDINPLLGDRIINRYANDINPTPTTGIAPANPKINTIAAPNQISPLDLAKLNLKGKELDFKNEALDKNLEFKQGKQEQDNEIRKTRAAVYKFKAEHPGMKFDFSGPTIKVADPITGEVHDTGMKSGHLSDAEKIELQGKKTLEQIGARGTENRLTNFESETLKNRDTLGQIAARAMEERKTNQDKPVINRSTTTTQSTKKGVTTTTRESKESKNNSFNSSTTKRFKTKDYPNPLDIPIDKIDQFKKDHPDAQEIESR